MNQRQTIEIFHRRCWRIARRVAQARQKKDKGGWFGARAGYLRPVKLKLISPAKLIIKEVTAWMPGSWTVWTTLRVNPELCQVWLNRHDDKKAENACRDSFK